MIALTLLLACTSSPETGGGACDDPQSYWRDADGDGQGEPGETYRGCNPPEGWVTVAAAESTEDTYLWDTGPFITFDSGDSGDSGGSGYSGWTGGTGWWGTAWTGGTGGSGWTGGTGATGAMGDTGTAPSDTGP